MKANVNWDEIVTTKTHRLWYDEHIVHSEIFHGSTVTLRDAESELRVADKLCYGERKLMLVDASGLKMMTKEARAFYASKTVAENTEAVAMVLDSSISKTIVGFYMKINRPHVRTELFTSVAEAKQWLLGHLVMVA